MADILELFKNLSKFYDRYLRLEDIEKIYDKVTKANKNDGNNKETNGINDVDMSAANSDSSDSGNENDEKTKHSKINCIEDIPMVNVAINDSQVLSVLQELCTMIRNIRESNTGYDNTYDSWDRVNEISPREKYFAFMFSLLRLVNYKPTSKLYRKLSMSAASAYILSLTIPGAKQYHIFDEIMINHILEIFHLIDLIQQDEISKQIQQQDRVEIWINFVNLCDDLKIMFRYVHFDEYKDVRNSIIWELNKLMFNLHVNGYDNICK